MSGKKRILKKSSAIVEREQINKIAKMVSSFVKSPRIRPASRAHIQRLPDEWLGAFDHGTLDNGERHCSRTFILLNKKHLNGKKKKSVSVLIHEITHLEIYRSGYDSVITLSGEEVICEVVSAVVSASLTKKDIDRLYKVAETLWDRD